MFSRDGFADDTDYERFVLDRLGTHRVRVTEPSAIYDRRGMEAGAWNTTVTVGTAVAGTRPREELRQSLRPLGFGAAYKVLDMLVEHVLRANGAKGRLEYEKKKSKITKRPVSLPTPLDAHPELWDRSAALYGEFLEARHAVTHRRAQVTATGDLEYREASQLEKTIPSTEIESFAAAVHALAELVIDARDDDRQVKIVTWHLNELRARHGLRLLPATDPNAHRRLLKMDIIGLDDGLFRFEVADARKTIDGQSPSLWDLRLYVNDRVFVGRWEEMSDHSASVFDFHPASPPQWLSEEVPAT
jgi:hypothetical protein